MNHIVGPHFRVNSFKQLPTFYRDCLGMRVFPLTQNTQIFGYSNNRARIQFEQKTVLPYQSKPNDFYWKIGITLRNLDVAVSYLRSQGILVSDPQQFRDIGYMSKIADPNGFIIELLQRGFEGREKEVGDGHAIGAQATLAHITLRITDLSASKHYFEQKLGMRLMSVQPVDEFGFCLYFYTWSDEPLPDPDLNSVYNREWLWRRPYTLIELQHLQKPNIALHQTDAEMAGFDGFSYQQPQDEKTVFVTSTKLAKLT